MYNPESEKQNQAKEWRKRTNDEAIKRVAEFMREDDESFFHRIIQGLTVPEIEEFLHECPEFQKFWDYRDEKQKSEK